MIISFEANATKIAEYAEYGLFVRKPENAHTGYYLDINPISQQVYFSLASPDAEETTILFSGQSAAIHQNAKNEILFFANDNTFILWINRETIFLVDDSTIQEPGTIGISVSPIGAGESEFEIDNLLVRAPVNKNIK